MAHDDGALTRELAQLARLELTDSQTRVLASQLDTILGYIRRLHAVDVTDVAEYAGASTPSSGLRDDDPGSGPVAQFDVDAALAGVPMLRERQVAIPKFKD